MTIEELERIRLTYKEKKDKIKKIFGMRTWADQEGIFKQYTAEELLRYGEVTGEIKFLPFEHCFRHNLKIAHTLMLKIKNEK